MIHQIQKSDNGVRIGNEKYNCFAYADDVTLFSATAPGLQNLINICQEYATFWRFKFGLNKTKCMIAGKVPFHANPSWFLGKNSIDTTSSLEILGSVFSSDCKSKLHIDKRLKSCRQCQYGLNPVGMCYPGLNTNVKIHLWRTTCLPALTYGCEALHIDRVDIGRINSAQGCAVHRKL